MTAKEVLKRLEGFASHDPKDLAGMARFGINVDKAWVISIPKLRKLAKDLKRELDPGLCHNLALEVYNSGIHEAKILAGFVDSPRLVTEDQMEKWVCSFDSWDVVDMVCNNLFDRTEFAVKKAKEWSKREEEFVKRAGFVLMAGLSVHDKKMEDEIFESFLKIIEREAWDERNFVRKAISWALRQIGKSRNVNLYQKSLKLSKKLYESENKSERWVGSDAYRELTKEYITKRFGK
jgi:3-methyladenine DNA glycosylase AlkD